MTTEMIETETKTETGAAMVGVITETDDNRMTDDLRTTDDRRMTVVQALTKEFLPVLVLRGGKEHLWALREVPLLLPNHLCPHLPHRPRLHQTEATGLLMYLP